MNNRDNTNPAFLLGAGRSGTTLLYKLMCLHPQVAYISNYDVRLGNLATGQAARLIKDRLPLKIKAWFNHGGNAYFVHRPWLKKLLPTPVEGEAIYEDCGIPLFSPPDFRPVSNIRANLQRKFAQIRETMEADVFITKRTANNRRLPALHSIFPEARCIHLIRDGREVADSLTKVEWWDSHILWWDGRTPKQLEQSGEDRLRIAARNWAQEMHALEEGLKLFAPGQVLEIRYERLLEDPAGQLRHVLAFLGLDMPHDLRDAIDTLQLHYRPGNWSSRWTAQQISTVMRETEPYLNHLGYV